MKISPGLLFFLLCLSMAAHAQTMKITGRIIDEESGEPIPFANIILKSSLTGTQADSAGKFRITITGRRDTLLISALGYTVDTVSVSPLTDHQLTIPLMPGAFNLSEVTVKMGENPAF